MPRDWEGYAEPIQATAFFWVQLHRALSKAFGIGKRWRCSPRAWLDITTLSATEINV